MTEPHALALRLAVLLGEAQTAAAALAAALAPSPAPAEAADAGLAVARAWYLRRLEHLVATGAASSREEDYEAALAAGLGVGREALRALRRELAPPSWQEGGRPPGRKTRVA